MNIINQKITIFFVNLARTEELRIDCFDTSFDTYTSFHVINIKKAILIRTVLLLYFYRFNIFVFRNKVLLDQVVFVVKVHKKLVSKHSH